MNAPIGVGTGIFPFVALAGALCLLLWAARRRDARAMWVVGAGVCVVAVVASLIVRRIPLYEHHCGPRCGSSASLRPLAIGVAALAAGALLGPTKLFGKPRPRLATIAAAVLAFIVLMAGADIWVS